jgi:hypothetical protein
MRTRTDLLDLDISTLTEHFSASRFSYSTQALPINVLLDTLIRPLGETENGSNKTCVSWQFDASRAVPHIVIGQTKSPGGQWVDNPVQASWDIGTLSYAGMLSLPGYAFEQHYVYRHHRPLPGYLRPSRRDVADYLATYPSKVGISDAIHSGQFVSQIARQGDGFMIGSHDIHCKHLVLATGIFSNLIAPRPLLQPLTRLPGCQSYAGSDPLLVIGSGFSAADVIISSPPQQKLLHIYKWAPTTSPSPLRACHQHAYPEYAGVYRQMKLAAVASSDATPKRPKAGRRASDFNLARDWQSSYEGLPNTEVIGVEMTEDGISAVVKLRKAGKNGIIIERRVGGLAYVVGRRGSLSYLGPDLLREILKGDMTESGQSPPISGQTLREAANDDLEVASNVFVIGSLTGDSLIRFAYGGCAYAAGKIMKSTGKQSDAVLAVTECQCSNATRAQINRFMTPTASPRLPAMNGLDGHEASPVQLSAMKDTPLDRRKLSSST